MGNILEKLKEYKQEIYLLIRKSGNMMEQVTFILCAAVASFSKKNNEEIMSLGRPSKRTKLSLRKKVAEATRGSSFSTTNIIQNTIEVGKQVVNLIKELQ